MNLIQGFPRKQSFTAIIVPKKKGKHHYLLNALRSTGASPKQFKSHSKSRPLRKVNEPIITSSCIYMVFDAFTDSRTYVQRDK